MYRDDWLALVDEPVMDPGRAICDPHHHLWDATGNRKGYGIEKLIDDFGGHQVQSTVFVECGASYYRNGPEALRPVGETAFIRRVAEGAETSARVCEGVVGFANLLLGDAVSETLEAHLDAGGGRFRGIRHSAFWADENVGHRSHAGPPPQMLLDGTFRKGFARLRGYGLSYDCWLFFRQIDELADLAKAFEDTPIVLDHFGGVLCRGAWAGRADEIFERWHPSISRLAECPNVYAKLGGIAMEMNGFGWEQRPHPASSDELAETYRRWYLHCIESFGPERCMFESNFPMDRASCSYRVLWNTFKKLVADFSDTEQQALFYSTAASVYRLQRADSRIP